jgi:hypothetical protein
MLNALKVEEFFIMYRVNVIKELVQMNKICVCFDENLLDFVKRRSYNG